MSPSDYRRTPLYLLIITIIMIGGSGYLYYLYQTITHQQTLNIESQKIFTDLNYSRQLAIEIGATVSICHRMGKVCMQNDDVTNWSNGWLIYMNSQDYIQSEHTIADCQPSLTDTSICILRENEVLLDNVRLYVEAKIQRISFDKEGVLISDHDSVLLEICATQESDELQDRALVISSSGHVTLHSDHACTIPA